MLFDKSSIQGHDTFSTRQIVHSILLKPRCIFNIAINTVNSFEITTDLPCKIRLQAKNVSQKIALFCVNAIR